LWKDSIISTLARRCRQVREGLLLNSYSYPGSPVGRKASIPSPLRKQFLYKLFVMNNISCKAQSLRI